MSNAKGPLRLRLSFDTPPPGMPTSTKYMILIEPELSRTVADVERVIKCKFGYSKGATLSLQLEGYTLPSTEKVEILHNDDSLHIQLHHIDASYVHTPKSKSKKRKMRSQSPQPNKKSKNSDRETENKPENEKKPEKKQSKDVKKSKHDIKSEYTNSKPSVRATVIPNSVTEKKSSLLSSKLSVPIQATNRKNDKCSRGNKKINVKRKKSNTQTIITNKGNKVTKFASSSSESSIDSDDVTCVVAGLNGKAKPNKTHEADKKNSSTSESSSSSSSEEETTLPTVKPELSKSSTNLMKNLNPILGQDIVKKAVENKDTFYQSSPQEATELKSWLATAMNKLAQKHADKKVNCPDSVKSSESDQLATVCDNEKDAITPKRVYEKLQALSWPPTVNDIIAYKILEMTEHYTPEISDFKEATILEVYSTQNSPTGTNTIKVRLLCPTQKAAKKHNGRFEMDLGESSDGDQNDVNDNECLLDWASLIDPRIVE